MSTDMHAPSYAAPSCFMNSANRFCTAGDWVQELFSALEVNTTCSKLYTSGHPMSTQAASHLATLLQTNHTISRICVGDSAFSDASLAALGPALRNGSKLSAIDLENKGITPAGLRQLLLDLRGSPSLSSLSLSRNAFGARGFEALCVAPLNVELLLLRSCGLTGAELAGASQAKATQVQPREQFPATGHGLRDSHCAKSRKI